MKKMTLIFATILIASNPLKADLGNCLVYHGKFHLKDGTFFKACFEVFGYEEASYLNESGRNRFCSDAGIWELYKMQIKETNNLTVYKNLKYLKLQPLYRNNGSELPIYGFVEEADLITLDAEIVSKIVFVKAEYSKRDWVTSRIIVGTKGVLDSIIQKRYWNYLVFSTIKWSPGISDIEDYEFDNPPFPEFILYNYNAQVNIAELKRLVRLKFPINFYNRFSTELMKKHNIKQGENWPPAFRKIYEETIHFKLNSLQNWFWEKGILIVRVNGTC